MLAQEVNTINIPLDKPIQEDYLALKELGIAIIQRFSKNVWTDFNAGDPGLTTLELLCYALNDLAYRTQLPLEDLLTENGQQSPFNKTNSYKAEEILTHNPLTIQDYRKLILDRHPEVRNVWLYPIKSGLTPNIFIHKNKKELTFDQNSSLLNEEIYIQGVYDVKVETIGKPKNIIGQINSTLQAHRNLCEDFYCVNYVEFEYVTICVDLDLDGTIKPEIIKEEIYKQLYLYCAPHLQRYSLKQMLEKGYPIEEIFEGPDLKNGFFDDKELADFDKKDVLYVSDLINVFMDIPGIANIQKIHLNSYASENDDADFNIELKKDEEYCLHLTDSNKAFRFFVDRKDKKGNKINFYYDGLKLFESDLVDEDQLIPAKEQIPTVEEQWEGVKSKPRNIKPYFSIQNEYPKTYLLGQEGIAQQESEERKIQRLQFKGYLLHFEQILANYFAQLNHAKKLLSWSSAADYRSYMYQSLTADEIKDLDLITSAEYKELFDHISNDDANDDFHDQVLNISAQQNFDRRNRFLNHLIARFNDSFVEFSIVEFFKKNNKTYGKHSIIADKKSFLRTYPYLSANRLKAMDYSQEVWNTTNISGYEMRVAKKLGLTNYMTSNPDLVFRHSLAHPVLSLENIATDTLTDFYNYNDENFDKQFGFHLIEHLLLRPRSIKDGLAPICNDNEENIINCFCKDPYSFRLTAILPGWLPITLNDGFRTYVERVFREELPAHLTIKLCWVGPQQMLEFEKFYFQYFKKLEKRKLMDCYTKKPEKNEKLINLMQIIYKLENVYYPSHIVDCEDIDFDSVTNEVSKHPSILGRTRLSAKMAFGVNWIKPFLPVYERYEEQENVIQYNEIGGMMTFYIDNKEVLLEDTNLLKLNFLTENQKKGKITFSNNSSIEIYLENDVIITSFRLENKQTNEVDQVWCEWDNNQIKLNLNRQIDFIIDLTKINQANDEFNFVMTNDQMLKKIFKIKKVESRLHLKQHEFEKLWLEKQYISTYPTPEIGEIIISDLISAFMKEVNERKLKQRKN